MTYHVAPLARSAFAACVGAALVVSAGTALGQAKMAAKPLQGQIVKLAWIDPLSGLMAPVGNNQLKSWQFASRSSTRQPGRREVRDRRLRQQAARRPRALNALKSATDQGIRYIIQGNGSRVALALVDAVNKYNERNPGKEVIYLN